MPKRSMPRLTKRIVERLKAEGKDAVFRDRGLAGFGVRVHTTGRKLYIVQSRGPAGLKRVTLGRGLHAMIAEPVKQSTAASIHSSFSPTQCHQQGGEEQKISDYRYENRHCYQQAEGPVVRQIRCRECQKTQRKHSCCCP